MSLVTHKNCIFFHSNLCFASPRNECAGAGVRYATLLFYIKTLANGMIVRKLNMFFFSNNKFEVFYIAGKSHFGGLVNGNKVTKSTK